MRVAIFLITSAYALAVSTSQLAYRHQHEGDADYRHDTPLPPDVIRRGTVADARAKYLERAEGSPMRSRNRVNVESGDNQELNDDDQKAFTE